MPIRLHHDFETFSEADLKAVGTSVYARHPSTEVLMCAYAFGDEAVQQWLPSEGQKMPADLRDALRDPDVIKIAWNKPFEWNVWKHVVGIEIPHDQWRDSMVLAYSLSLPGSLDKAGKVVGLPSDTAKMADGRKLVRRFCVPRNPSKHKPWTRSTRETDPEEWETFKQYNRQDVEAERAIWLRLRKWNMPAAEWRLWWLDQQINERGIPIRRQAVESAIRLAEVMTEAGLEEMRDLTDLDNPNSVPQLLPWLRQNGYPFDDLKKGHVGRALDECLADELGLVDPDYRRVLELRREVSKASVKKYISIIQALDDDDRLRNTLQFAGAGRTWRWCLAEDTAILVKDQTGSIYEKPIQNVTTDDLVWDGIEWVMHEGVVFSGDKEVIEHDGIVATAEHIVYLSDTESVPLGQAKEEGRPLWPGKNMPSTD